MKLFLLFTCFLQMSLSAVTFSQGRRVDIDSRGGSLEMLFREIQRQTGYSFIFNYEELGNVRLGPVRCADEEVDALLTRVLGNIGYRHTLENDIIIVSPAPRAQQQTIRLTPVKGRVVDEQNLPLPGVTIAVKGMNVATSSDKDGNFQLRLPGTSEATLVFTSIGMEKKEVKYAGQEFLAVIMKEEIRGLDEIVVTGIFNLHKESYTGSARTITDAELKQFHGRNIFITLGNIDPAFNIIPNNDWGNDPNRLPEIQIRGAGSLPNIDQLQDQTSVALNTPLIILDGFETSLQRMMDLNASEIKSIVLLKDGQATALYGSRGANGVVVITTREPEAGRLRLTYNGMFNTNIPDLNSYHLLRARDKLELERLSGFYESDTKNVAQNIGLQQYYNEVLAEVIKGVDTYWLSKPLRVGIDQNHNLRLEGGDANFRYALSAQFHDIEGVMKGSGRNVFNGSADISYKHAKLLFRNNLQVGHARWNESPHGSFSGYARLNPYWKPYDENGKVVQFFTPYNWDYMTQTGRHVNPYPNPMFDATLNTYDESSRTALTNTFSIEWIPVEGLILNGGAGLSGSVNDRDDFKPAGHSIFSEYGEADLFRKGRHDYSSGKEFNYTANLSARFSRLFAGEHRVFAGVRTEWTQNESRSYSFRVEGYPDEDIDFLSAGLQYEQDGSPGGSESAARRVGFGGSANYAYMDRYLFDFSYNVEGSSQFGANRRFAPFLSVGVGWNLHHEPLIRQHLPFVNRWKLRGTFGSTGSQQFSAYQALDTYRYYTGDRYKGWIGAYQVALGNENLEWQKTDKYNAGIEVDIFNSRLMVVVDLYAEKTSNLLSSLELPYSNGFTEYIENIGEVENKGFEVRATAWIVNDARRRVAWSVTGNLAHNRDKIAKLSEAMKAANERLANTISTNPNKIIREGDSQNDIYVVRSLGIDPSTGKELYLNKDDEVTYAWRAADRVKFGNSQPKFRGNFSTLIRYKNLSLNASFNYLWGGQKYNSTLVDKVENADKLMNVDERVLQDRWKQPGDKTFFRGLNEYSTVYYSSRFVQDEAVFACQNINVSYEARDQRWLNRLGARSFTVTANTGELFYLSTIRRERGIDYPFTRQFSLSMSVIF
ncbi:MAG: SusC/RagA family TonB-linked outer membrane protein [Odoribacteraceae bacterium]|nr:SusC/RagA family TonB-linked outer membrane protein [Odoribacteraceae bacterium]